VWELGSWGRLAVDETVEIAGRRLRVCGWIAYGDDDVLHRGVRYRRVERYRCRWQAAGIEGMTGPGTVQVADFAAEDGERLAALEDWGEGPELALGRWLHPRDVGR
jgi:hypothetical protein